MAKDSSAKYYQKKRIRRKLRKGIKIFLFHNTVVNNIKISQKMKKQRLVAYRKNYYKIWKKKDDVLLI